MEFDRIGTYVCGFWRSVGKLRSHRKLQCFPLSIKSRSQRSRANAALFVLAARKNDSASPMGEGRLLELTRR